MQNTSGIASITRIAALFAAALLVACAPAPPRAVVEDRVHENAQEAYDKGAWREAARLWQQQAIDAVPAEASRLRVKAADAWMLAGENEAAQNLMAWIDQSRLPEGDAALMNLVLAEIALAQGRPLEAGQRLDQVGRALPESYASRYLTLSGQIESALSGISAQSILKASEMARDIHGYDASSALELMRQLEQVPSGQLAYLPRLESDPQRAAWFDLALVLRNNLVSGKGLEAAVHDWARRHPHFDVSASEALDLWLRYRQDFRHPRRVAVLLPDSGGLKAAGAAIRDGIMSAYLQQPSGSEIRFYGTGEQPDSVLAAYFQAADDGADWIIGPLDRNSVEALLNLAGLATPVLALNDLPDVSTLPEGLAQQVFGISLSQEGEARAVARRMAQLGYERAVLLAPDNTWGERITQAFEADFLQEDRKILVAARYLPEENDHSQVLERALQIDESKARKQRLEDRLGIPLEFEPVRRSDVDAIFLAARPEQGKLLAPQLRFFEAGDIPTFATSGVYTGRPDPASNQDLDGLNVPLTSWQLQHPTPESIPKLESLRGGELAALFAIGMDAWNILPWLELMRNDPDFRFLGQTGRYSLTGGGNLSREPDWGRFSGGVPLAVDGPASGPSFAGRPR